MRSVANFSLGMHCSGCETKEVGLTVDKTGLEMGTLQTEIDSVESVEHLQPRGSMSPLAKADAILEQSDKKTEEESKFCGVYGRYRCRKKEVTEQGKEGFSRRKIPIHTSDEILCSSLLQRIHTVRLFPQS